MRSFNSLLSGSEYRYRQFKTTNSALCPHSVFIFFVWFSQQSGTISPHTINWLLFLMETHRVLCGVITKYSYIMYKISSYEAIQFHNLKKIQILNFFPLLCTQSIFQHPIFCTYHCPNCLYQNDACNVWKSSELYILYSSLPVNAVGWGTMLQAWRSRVRFPTVSFEFFIDIILPDALWPWTQLSL